ncbi:hypothetical protein [Bdellovibrio sp. HCB337]|uniref:hypothetical protein n=1 Tax=Bdellovibrio sp. HCB337 TaxID=3394358 RepID=UPI0039A71D13
MRYFLLTLIGCLLSCVCMAQTKSLAFDNDWARGYVQTIDSAKTLTVISAYSEFRLGEMLVVQSHDPGQDIIGFVQVESIATSGDGQFILKVRLVRHSKYAMVQLGDVLFRMDFNTFHEEYKGTTELIMKNEDPDSSSSYRGLIFMGLSAGETAQTLRKYETLISIFGYLDYGFTSNLTVGTILPADFLSAPNIQAKYKFHESDSNIFTYGMNYFWSPESSTGVVNATFFWDSISSESVISHTNLTLALASFDEAKNLTALKGAGTSSLQSGYEFILQDWNRVLVGPSYNFESKTVGGYVSYVWIWDHFHTQLGVSTTDISNLVYNVQDGYYLNFELYWRF